jgi:hypothetical protein
MTLLDQATNYVQRTVTALEEAFPGKDPALLNLYAVLALTRGVKTTLEDVHDAWGVWRNTTRPDHPSLVPFAELDPETQELDRKYVVAIRRIAADQVTGGIDENA